MNIKYLGTEYGGWVVDLDSINDGDVIICGGVGEDISFEEELLKYKDITIIEIDPTEKSHRFLETRLNSKMKLIKGAIESDDKTHVKIYKNKFPDYVSESVNTSHSYVYDEFHESEVISIKKLKEEYKPSFIKLDIEGSEYNVLEECIGINQVCVEFHHHCLSDKSYEDTMMLVNKFLENNYQIIDNRKNYQELTFLLKK
jgi:FkbM family methyltransferase